MNRSTDSILELARHHHQQGHLEQAEHLYRQLIREAPASPDLWLVYFLLGSVCHARNQSADAVAHLRQSVQLKPDSWHAHNHLGIALAARDEWSAAEACFRRALQLQPEAADLYANLANPLWSQGKLDEAEAAFRQALRLQPGDSRLHLRLAQLLARANKIDDALAAYARADALAPRSAHVHSAWGSCLIDLGQIDEAVVHLHAALGARPGHAAAWASLCELDRENCYPLSEDEIDQLRRLAAAPDQPAADRLVLHFALGTVLEKRGHPDEAFRHFRQGNDLKQQALQRAGRAFDPVQHTQRIDAAIATFTPAYFQHVADFGHPSERPVFIVGVPRSGTTLVAQILSAHPDVSTAGELQDMPALAVEVAGLDRPTVQALAERYLRRLDQVGGAGARVIDKLPENYFHLGLIATLFPRARIIHCRRDPRDTCVSCYTSPFDRLAFTTSLENLGRYYRDYERLMAHWRRVLPVPIHDVAYEELVARQETVSRELVACCGLTWSERCLAFHAQRGVVQTLSRLQIRQPIYTRSVQRWRRYAAHLGPLLDALGPLS